VREQQRPGFLAGEGRRASAQDAAGAADGPLQVEERYFDQPSFLVQGCDLAGGVKARVEQRGEQPDRKLASMEGSNQSPTAAWLRGSFGYLRTLR